MADWKRAKLGDVVERGGEWWRTIVVPVSGPDEDPREAPPAAKAPKATPRRVPRRASEGDDL